MQNARTMENRFSFRLLKWLTVFLPPQSSFGVHTAVKGERPQRDISQGKKFFTRIFNCETAVFLAVTIRRILVGLFILFLLFMAISSFF